MIAEFELTGGAAEPEDFTVEEILAIAQRLLPVFPNVAPLDLIEAVGTALSTIVPGDEFRNLRAAVRAELDRRNPGTALPAWVNS